MGTLSKLTTFLDQLDAAELHYTLDDLSGNPKTRTWVSRPATIENNRIIADLPGDDGPDKS